MGTPRRTWLRGALTLAVLGLFGAAALITNAGAVAERREASKKFVRKVVKRKVARAGTQITNQITNTTIGEDELIRFFLQMDQGSADQPIGTAGAFTLRTACDDDGANFDAFIEITTSENNSALDSTSGYDDEDFDTGETGIVQSFENVPDADPPAVWNGNGVFHAASPGGTAIQGPTTIFTNFDGFDCTFFGTISKVAPD
ncbi:MAG: hypothetical protein ACRDJP_10620 [Actinomycetota bacterium]